MPAPKPLPLTSKTDRPDRKLADIQGRPIEGKEYGPPEHFNDAQRAAWWRLFDTCNDADIICSLDIMALDVMAAVYTKAMHPDCKLSEMRMALTALGSFGLVPKGRENIKPVKKDAQDELGKLRARFQSRAGK